jgi:hypothetical protein
MGTLTTLSSNGRDKEDVDGINQKSQGVKLADPQNRLVSGIQAMQEHGQHEANGKAPG